MTFSLPFFLRSKKNKAYFLAFLLVQGLLFSLFSSTSISSLDTAVRVDPQASTVWGVDETFAINITVTEVVGLSGWEFKLYYDASILNGTTITEGSFLKTSGETFFNANISTTAGMISAMCALMGNVPAVDGSGVLATITFKTKSLGSSLLQLSDTILGDVNGNRLPHMAWSGAVDVVQIYRDIAVTSATASPLSVAEGQLVTITVAVSNLGKKAESFDVVAYANETAVAIQSVTGLVIGAYATLSLVWNTTGAAVGNMYVVRAEATAVEDEIDLGNNILTADTIEIIQGIHDVAVKTVKPSRTQVYQGQPVDVSVTVTNKGDYTETFIVTAYYNDTAFATRTVSDLLSGGSQSVTLTWSTAGLAANRSYTIKATANVVSGETSFEDNTLTDGNVTVLPRSMLSITIVSVTPCNQVGDPRTSFSRGTMAYFKVSINSNSIDPETLLLTANVYDQTLATIGMISFKGQIAPGNTTYILGSPIPQASIVGNAVVYVNALTDWPYAGGVPYCPEAHVTFGITGP